ncbi:hypothetical protein H257_18564 [Aphanomyces astaci]|uniref:Uncharacterized protein n=1 Tax=Aphanomyces astaci TaxID=112090 RepID=W4FAQ8_APHAT|nr:hypothetical protein H257_18564 [Aphanomyces astaci]ETV64560.1 hypothetical protein H257_18564 [Aphanomyces astaci]RQM28378.1 hypothetical protein B5M09_009239 [Aphanomyces astaci]|eukprot:XP_009845957.1 hypothetical protein H257_18564 [Aphanomyces astaci]
MDSQFPSHGDDGCNQSQPFEIHFTASNFRPQYQRNNKKGGLKNLRCFPNCCSGTHATTGFCGGSVLVGVRPEHVRGRRQLAIYAEFCCVVDGHPQGHAALHDTFTQAQIHHLSNKDANIHAPWYTGDVLQGSHDEGYIYSINTFKRGWHYGWTSNRHTSVTQHVLCVYAFELQDDTLSSNNAHWTCICASPSPQFQLYCRRRAKARVATPRTSLDDALVKVESPDEADDDDDSIDLHEPPKKHRRSLDFDEMHAFGDPYEYPPTGHYYPPEGGLQHGDRQDGTTDREFLLPPSCVMEIPELVEFCNMQND